MATGLLALLDDLTTLLDDVSALSKVAAQKTAGIAGDDLAVNAEGLVGIDPSRELPIIGKVFAGSLANKFVLVPLALALPAAAITPLLMLGGTFLCYEGVHKVAHKKDAHDDAHHQDLVKAIQESPDALAKLESEKVKGAIVTDVVLSAEIVAVSLGAVATAPFWTKATTLAVVALGMTFAIYGLVALIVKLDDVGLHLQQTRPAGSGMHSVGRAMVDYTPAMMRGISVLGTIAMFLVGGGILAHGIPGFEDWLHHAVHDLTHNPWIEDALHKLATLILGVIVGGITAALVAGVNKALGREAAH